MDVAVGGWTCGCGATTWGRIKATFPTEMWVKCPHCGDEAAILPEALA